LNRRDAFDGLFALYLAALGAPAVGEAAGPVAYVVVFAGVWTLVYAGVSKIEDAPEHLARRPAATVVVTAPLVYGFAYVFGAEIGEPPVRSPYVYLGLWNVVVGVAVVAVARRC